MLDHLPELLDPFEFVEKKRRIKGVISLVGMERVRDAILNPDTPATLDLEFKREGRIATIVGNIEADLALSCQCCLDTLDWPVRCEVKLGVVRSIDESLLLPDDYEPLVVEESEGVVALADIVQDELLLALPAIPRHAVCQPPGTESPPKAKASREHPFAVLAQLKKNPS